MIATPVFLDANVALGAILQKKQLLILYSPETTQKKANDVSELTNTNTLYLCVGRDVIGSFAIVGALGQPPERTSHCAKKTWIVWRNHTFHYG